MNSNWVLGNATVARGFPWLEYGVVLSNTLTKSSEKQHDNHTLGPYLRPDRLAPDGSSATRNRPAGPTVVLPIPLGVDRSLLVLIRQSIMMLSSSLLVIALALGASASPLSNSLGTTAIVASSTSVAAVSTGISFAGSRFVTIFA